MATVLTGKFLFLASSIRFISNENTTKNKVTKLKAKVKV